MQLDSLDHVHFSVPDLARAEQLFRPWLPGEFTPAYGSEEMNAFGVWNMSGGDFIQAIDPTKPVFGGARIDRHGILSVSFRVQDVDAGIKAACAAGLELRSRVGSEDIGMGKNVIQAQFDPTASFGLGIELVEREIPGDPHVPMTESSVDYIEHTTESVDAPRAFLTGLLESAFEPVAYEEDTGARSFRNARFGIQLTEPSGDDGPVHQRLAEFGAGLHAIAFRSSDLDRDSKRAEDVGLKLAVERGLGPGARELEFLPEAGMILRLVERREN